MGTKLGCSSLGEILSDQGQTVAKVGQWWQWHSAYTSTDGSRRRRSAAAGVVGHARQKPTWPTSGAHHAPETKTPRASPPDTKPADCLGAVRVRLGRGGAVAPGAGVSACSGCFLCFPGWCYTTAAAAAPGSSMPHYNSSTAGTSRGCTAPPNMHLAKHDLADAIVR